jgi:hypothetical protein
MPFFVSSILVMARKKRYIIPLKLVELESGNYHILLSSLFDSGDLATWVVDTGASKTVYDLSKANNYTPIELNKAEIQSAGIGEGTIETGAGMLHAVAFEQCRIENLSVALIDLSHINELYHNFAVENISGLLGSDFLYKHKAVIDYKKLVLKIYV